MSGDLQAVIDAAWDARETLSTATRGEVRDAVDASLEALDAGTLRVAAKGGGRLGCQPVAQEGRAALLPPQRQPSGPGPRRHQLVRQGALQVRGLGRESLRDAGFRAVPGAIVRRGAFVARGVVLMPSFVNIGAYVGEGTMVDTWATVGSCAQIGRNVHLSGGVGIGGVLEPLQAGPVVIEDGCFIGARSEVVEGVGGRGRRRAGDGRLSLRHHQDRRPRERRDLRRPRAGLFGGRARHAAGQGRRPRPLLRGDRQARRRADPLQTAINELLRD